MVPKSTEDTYVYKNARNKDTSMFEANGYIDGRKGYKRDIRARARVKLFTTQNPMDSRLEGGNFQQEHPRFSCDGCVVEGKGGWRGGRASENPRNSNSIQNTALSGNFFSSGRRRARQAR